jgi:acetate CoA/acetoacetate CoA-transferase alpha subunit
MSSDFTIFLIDDDSAVLKSLDRLLQAAGYETKAYLSAETFLSEHDPSTPGCAVLDLALPHLNGLHVQQALTRQGNNRPVIFLTGQANVQESVEAMKAVKAVVSAMKTTSVEDAVAMIPDGASLMIGGFMAVGSPERVIDELVRQGKRNLTVIANDTALPGRGIGKLIDEGLVSRTVASHIGLNPETQRQMMDKKMAVDLVPQGTLIERIRAGGFGLGGILTPTGIGTIVEEGKQKINVNGKSYLVETALRADFALVNAFLADYLGNLSYALTARNFNPVMAMAGETTIVTAEHIVPVGLIAPDHVVTPAPLVDYLVANG